MAAKTPIASGAPPVRTKFTDPKSAGAASGISWPWLKWFQQIYSFLAALSFANIDGQVSVPSQIGATGTPGPTTALFGDGSWKAVAGGGAIDGMIGDGVVYEAAVPIVAGDLVPELATHPAGSFLATPAAVAGPWQARPLTAADFAGAIASASVQVEFTTPAGKQDTTAKGMIAAPWVKATSTIVCAVAGGTPDHPATDEDATIEGITAGVSDIIPESGFTVTAYAPQGSAGLYNVNCIGVN